MIAAEDAAARLRQLRAPGWVAQFRAFATRGNVVDLAVGIVVGAAFTSVVQSLVKDVVTPVIGLLVGGIDFANVFVTLKGPHAATLAEAQRAGAVTLNVGLFLNAAIAFLIVAFAVFWTVKLLTRLHLHEDAAAAPTRSEALLAEIRDLLAREAPAASRERAPDQTASSSAPSGAK